MKKKIIVYLNHLGLWPRKYLNIIQDFDPPVSIPASLKSWTNLSF